MNKYIIVLLVLVFSVVLGTIPGSPLGTSQPVSSTRRVLLTFDDGPDPRYTPQILSILREHGIKAVFFVVGKQVLENPELLQEIASDGHLLANHTFTHASIDRMTPEELLAELRRTDAAVAEIAGKSMHWFRPPRGLYTDENYMILQNEGKEVLMWDAGLEKENITEPARLVINLIKRVSGRRSMVLLLHDGNPHNNRDRAGTVEALPMLINELQQMGCAFIDPSSTEGNDFMRTYASVNQRYR